MYEILEWDSNFFNYKVAKINLRAITDSLLSSVLSELKDVGVKLAYLSCDPDCIVSNSSAINFGGLLLDKKVTFSISLNQTSETINVAPSEFIIEEYQSERLSESLERLAIQAGEFSRFKLDPNISDEQFRQLYKLWCLNSINRSFADVVFVVRNKNEELAMVTVKKQEKIVNIGLIAVSPELRNKGVGSMLLSAVINWSRSNQVCQIKVVTQEDNLNACGFYRKSGFHIQNVENIYHFWNSCEHTF